MVYPKAKFKGYGGSTSCLKPYLAGNMPDKFLPTLALLYISIRHIFISRTSFVVKPNAMRILYKTYFLTES